MPINPRTKITLLLIAAIIFALTSAVALVGAFQAHQQNENAKSYIAQAVIYFSLCIVFVSVARIIKRKASQSEQGDSSNKSQ